MRSIDLNCDMGEGCGSDAELMQYISSANIACGFHAGDPETMRVTAELAMEHGVAIGAHPSFPDRENFGRTAMQLPPGEVFDIVLRQISDLSEICRRLGVRLHHVKPHGALYNQAAKDAELAAAIAEAVCAVDPALIVYGLAGSLMVSAAESIGLKSASEVFADRTYQPDGSLTPRARPDAIIEDTSDSLQQVLRMVTTGTVTAVGGTPVELRADTICIHGDGPHAVQFSKAINTALTEHGFVIAAV